ncbi:DUF4132 domain-containing protein [Actinomadura rugatobispora]|uniref:DUF4132 domain-containing protein n=1 Tax=Actinomadura rugatobispora TaxID=1994 RepID=A0ABW1A0Z7_9ACTN|nr:hypothetical protein GCM10010200_038520 [Actinomadura rugatobispora]
MDDQLPDMPDTWRRQVHPRRGGRHVPEVEIDASAPGRLAAWVEEHSAHVQKALEAGGEPAAVASTRRYLGGEADPVGAAVVVLLLVSATPVRPGPLPDWIVDAWTAQHGLAFAACATVHLNAVEVYQTPNSSALSIHHRDDGTMRVRGNACLRRARILLAAADEGDYGAAVEGLERHRKSSEQRLEAAYLAPTRHDWVEECCQDPAVNDYRARLKHWMLMCSVGTQAHADLMALHFEPVHYGYDEDAIATLVDGLGAAAVPLLKAWLDRFSVESGKQLLRGLAILPADEAFQILVDRVDDKHAQPVLIDAMGRFPVRALRLLGPVAAGTSRTAGVAADLLRGHLRAHHDTVVSALPGLPDEAREAVAPMLEALAGSRVPDAPADALPKLLVEPPWAARGKKAKPVVINGLTAPESRSIVWAPGERERWATPRYGWGIHWKDEDDPVQVFRRYGVHNQLWVLASAPEEQARSLLPMWAPNYDHVYPADPRVRMILARFEDDAFHVFSALLKAQQSETGDLVLPFLDAETAAYAARWLVRVRRLRKVALAWFDRHGLNAVPYLLPAALGKQGAARGNAEAALRLLASRHGTGPIAEAARAHGDRAADAIAAMLAADPLDALPARMPKIGAWADPELLPQVLLRDRERALPAQAAGHLLSMVAISKPDEVYPGVGIVRDLCDRESLAEFAWEVFRRWDTHGAQSSDGWALAQLGWLGDDGTVRRLTPLLRTWSADRRTPRVVAGLDVLAAIGSDVALMRLNGVAQSARSTSLRKRARERLDEVAAELELTPERLADRLAPDFGLDADGGMTLDYGPRRFRVGFDEQLKPCVIDEDGKPRKSLPRPGAADDPELAPAAHKRFAALKKDVAAVAGDQLHRLERAMADLREWPVDEFRTFIVEHPLVWHIARRLVWTSRSGDGAFSFRIAEDRSFADVKDAEVTLPETARISIAHPLHLDGELGPWSELLADYEIIQPFAQLGRPVHALTEEERDGDRMGRFEGVEVSTGRILALRSRAWDASETEYGSIVDIARKIPDGCRAVIAFTPGIQPEIMDPAQEQKITSVSVVRDGDESAAVRLGDVDPAVASELVADLTRLTAS